MTHRKSSGWSDGARAAVLAFIVGSGMTGAQAFRDDEVECEEAVAYLDQCCPGFDPGQVNCTHTSNCSGTIYPAITPEDSRCIRDKSCSEIEADGICAAVLAPQETDYYASGDDLSDTDVTDPLEVCH